MDAENRSVRLERHCTLSLSECWNRHYPVHHYHVDPCRSDHPGL
jgi:hypothetical protein